MGTASDDDLICRRIAAETGAVIASVDYRLAPRDGGPRCRTRLLRRAGLAAQQRRRARR
ncbi:MAG: alpha/beta hydrolase fold domain-containing protein [Streptosporangiaceae bacterium]